MHVENIVFECTSIACIGREDIHYSVLKSGNLTTYTDAGGTVMYTDTYNYTGADQTDRVTVNSSNYAYGALGLGSASNGGANTYYTRDNNGKLVSQRTSTGTYYYSLNSLGSVSVITDSTGAVKNTYAYDPWGNSLGKTEAVSNPWQFAGGFLDATTGLYKFGTRYYSPMLGRWTQQDSVGGSVGKVGSGNAYVYAGDAPVMRTDPSGQNSLQTNAFLCVAGAALGIVALAITTVFTGGLAAVAALSAGAAIGSLVTGCVSIVVGDYITQYAHSGG